MLFDKHDLDLLPSDYRIRLATTKDCCQLYGQYLLLWIPFLTFPASNIFIVRYSIREIVYYLCLMLLIGTIITTLAYITYLSELKNKQVQLWIIEYQKQIVARAKIIDIGIFCLLVYVSVNHKYRHRKLGSCLISKTIINTKKPIYLYCLPRLQSFYNQFGFKTIPQHKAPRQLRSFLSRYKIMVLHYKNKNIDLKRSP